MGSLRSFASAFFEDTEDALLADAAAATDLAEPAGAVTRAGLEDAWPEAADLAFGGGDMEGGDDDEEETSPGDIEEDPDDLPANDLITLRNAAVVDMEID